ncbi:MAG: D-tyrosyl-tRNA(Tyr) deacylase [Bacteroidetes bacterium HGW-Bacteroidetes-21]|jgi:D-tyrosyl-tRNA(Tyr) deacylase|nr:MAG: D-tyrosyl-tRNA(Tyr) deacylase [Bacteroidetes bacterium HGW-Bacteroidetes-21]
MRVVIQRVSAASVTVEGKITGKIGKGLLILAGFEEADTIDDVQWMSSKIAQLRIFNDSDGHMNLSVIDVSGEILVVSQFTLHALTKKGNRPSFIKAARADVAIPLYKSFIAEIELVTSSKVAQGIFGAMMEVALVNDGPVTIIIDSRNKE